jgi:glycosyltransferase XagB
MMLYTWSDRRHRRQHRAPKVFESPQSSFTVLLPARHEEAVIQQTIDEVLATDYPNELLEVVVICCSDDLGTIAKVEQKIRQLAVKRIRHNVRLMTFDDGPINKPHGLNVGLWATEGDIVTLFDAEDGIHPDIFNVINTVFYREPIHNVIQMGVQLMDFKSQWFSALNVLEYFFWFKSSLHFHAKNGVIPLGGNTVFFRRPLLERLGGWDETCLTEDADIGMRLSLMGERVRVIYEDKYVTREETPPTVKQFIKQRSRWNQGFFQVLKRGYHWKLPTLTQRLIASYTLSAPFLQCLTMLYLPVSIYTMVFVKLPSWIALFLMLPIYMLVAQYLVSWIGLQEFSESHNLKLPRLMWLRLLVFFYPFQLLLGVSAIRAFWREVIGINSWEKTVHTNAHRKPALADYVPLAVARR